MKLKPTSAGTARDVIRCIAQSSDGCLFAPLYPTTIIPLIVIISHRMRDAWNEKLLKPFMIYDRLEMAEILVRTEQKISSPKSTRTGNHCD